MLNSFSHAYAQSDLFGRLIFLSLYALSLITWMLLFYKAYIFWKLHKKARDLPPLMQAPSQQSIFTLKEQLLDISPTVSSPFRKLYTSFKDLGLKLLSKNQQLQKSSQPCFLEGDLQVIEGKLHSTLNSCLLIIEKQLYILGMIVSLAPFLGLLGTVWGILITLSHLQHASSVQSNEMVLGGLSLALTTTVLGLVIAIPALIGANIFKAQLKVIQNELIIFCQQLLEKAEIQFKTQK